MKKTETGDLWYNIFMENGMNFENFKLDDEILTVYGLYILPNSSANSDIIKNVNTVLNTILSNIIDVNKVIINYSATPDDANKYIFENFNAGIFTVSKTIDIVKLSFIQKALLYAYIVACFKIIGIIIKNTVSFIEGDYTLMFNRLFPKRKSSPTFVLYGNIFNVTTDNTLLTRKRITDITLPIGDNPRLSVADNFITAFSYNCIKLYNSS
jgi:hypothetical protein